MFEFGDIEPFGTFAGCNTCEATLFIESIRDEVDDVTVGCVQLMVLLDMLRCMFDCCLPFGLLAMLFPSISTSFFLLRSLRTASRDIPTLKHF
jgi:hypothetical protein